MPLHICIHKAFNEFSHTPHSLFPFPPEADDESYGEIFHLSVPPQAIEGSERAKVNIIGRDSIHTIHLSS